jgi:hypothetical protein
MQDFSVREVLGAVFGFLRHLLEPLHHVIAYIPWNFGDWTIFMALALPLLGSLLGRALGQRGDGHGFKLFALGILLGGIIEHYQPWLARCATGNGCG